MTTEFFNSAQSAVTYAATVAEVILLVRLAWLGLLREFKIFSIFLAFDAVLTAALVGWDYHAYGYEWIWVVTAPLWTLLLAAASFELLRGVVQAFPMETITRTVALFGFLIGMTISAVASMLAHPQAISRSAILLTIIGRRSILSGCILAIFAQGAVFFIGNAPIMANWKLHRRVLLTFLTVVVIGLFAATIKNRQFADWIYLLRSVSLLGCFCVWTIRLRRLFSNLHVWKPTPGLLIPPTNEQFADILVFNRRAALAKQRLRESKVRKPLLPDTKRRENPI